MSHVTPTKRGVRSLDRRIAQIVRDMDLLEKQGKRPVVTLNLGVESGTNVRKITGLALPLPSELGGRAAAVKEIQNMVRRQLFGSLNRMRRRRKLRREDLEDMMEEEGIDIEDVYAAVGVAGGFTATFHVAT